MLTEDRVKPWAIGVAHQELVSFAPPSIVDVEDGLSDMSMML